MDPTLTLYRMRIIALPHEMWISMKAVSHFNLGISLELMLKLLLKRKGISWKDIKLPKESA